jgi:polar amino acid transport system permease protein
VQLLLRGEYAGWLRTGLRVSLQLSATALVLALPLALGVAVLRLSPQRPLRWLGTLYVEGLRNVPLLAWLLFWYFGAPELLPAALKERLYAGDVEFTSAAIALTLYIAAYMAEDIRSGIRAVPLVQFEAGRALGFGFGATLRKVVLPQALPVMVPPLLSQALNLWKDSSLATVIGVGELMYQAARVESATFRSAEAFAFVTAAYLLVSLLLTSLAAWTQRRVPVHHRS